MSAVYETPMIEKNGTGIQAAEGAFAAVEKNGTGIGRRGVLRSLIEKNGTGMRALSGGMMLLAMSVSAATMAQEKAAGYVIVEGGQATISINNETFSSSGQAAVQNGYSAIPMKIIDARQLDLRFAAMRPLSEGSGTGSPESEGSGTGSPESEGSGTGRPDSEGSGTGKPLSEGSGTGRTDSEGSGTGWTGSESSGTGWTGSEGSGTGQPEGIAMDICISGGQMSSQGCDSVPGGRERPMVVDGFAEVVIEGDMAFVLVHQLNMDGSLSELATLELPVLQQ